MKKIVVILLLCVISNLSRAQNQGSDEWVKNDKKFGQTGWIMPGVTLPDIPFDTMVTHTSMFKSRLSEYKGKLVIIDTWSQNCRPCIENLPHMEELQKEFGDRIKIIPYAIQDYVGIIDTLWEKNRYTKKVNIATVAGADVQLHRVFPGMGVWTAVWIDQEGKLLYITETDFVTKENIQRVLNKEKIKWPPFYGYTFSNVFNIGYTFPPLLTEVDNYKVGKASNAFYSTITSWLPVQGGGDIVIDSSRKIKRKFHYNTSILDLYMIALKYDTVLPKYNKKNRFLLEVKDLNRYINLREKHEEFWHIKNRYCYEATFPIEVNDQGTIRALRADLERFFQIHGRVEKREVPCLILKRVSSNDDLLTNYGKSKKLTVKYESPEEKNKDYKNPLNAFIVYKSMKSLTEGLNNSNSEPTMEGKFTPVIDETGFTGPIFIPIEFDMTDQELRYSETVRKKLQEYGLDLVPGKRVLEMFVITENDYKKP